jgi:hypothetical protein
MKLILELFVSECGNNAKHLKDYVILSIELSTTFITGFKTGIIYSYKNQSYALDKNELPKFNEEFTL